MGFLGNYKVIWQKAACLLCFLTMLCNGFGGIEDRDRILKRLDKINVHRFATNGETRDEVIKKLNQVLHQADPHTEIEIVFVPPPASLKINEQEFGRFRYVDEVKDCTVSQLMRILGTVYGIDWKISGNKVQAVQGVSY